MWRRDPSGPPPDTTPRVTAVSVTPATASVVVGDQTSLTATVTAVNGASTAVSWTTSNASIATVSTSGQVQAVAVGSATITATSTFDATKSGFSCSNREPAASRGLGVYRASRTSRRRRTELGAHCNRVSGGRRRHDGELDYFKRRHRFDQQHWHDHGRCGRQCKCHGDIGGRPHEVGHGSCNRECTATVGCVRRGNARQPERGGWRSTATQRPTSRL